MELAIFNSNGQETGRKLKLNSDIYGIEPNDHAIRLDPPIIHNERGSVRH